MATSLPTQHRALQALRDNVVGTVNTFVEALKYKFKNNADAMDRVMTADRRFKMIVVNVSDMMKDTVTQKFAVRFNKEISPLYERIAKGDETFVDAIRNEMFLDMGFDKLFAESNAKTRAVMVQHIQAICAAVVQYCAMLQPGVGVGGGQ